MKSAAKIALSTLLGIAVLTIAGMGFLWNTMYEPFVQPPEIVRNLPANFHEADLLFKDRVAMRYKPGTRENELIARLTSEGFYRPGRAPTGVLQKDRLPLHAPLAHHLGKQRRAHDDD